ncbi:nickel-dependent lactate racemase [Hungatella hathewayi]|uniref:nickel-dependent lactate racemase n=1 Tax=Hungatella hathewayi TaxID=154046 RepID=UPI00033D8868|nr:nickel-dependent lactate racemase [Hungatella hathewayi]CCZ62358.1 uncharacterized protein BN544_04609 [Hungatella hathewayi CAG:224]
MPGVVFPYGRETRLYEIAQERYAGTLVSALAKYNPEKSQEELVKAALESPVGSLRLSELARGKKKVVLIASDHTRPVPSKVIIPQMLQEIRMGNSEADITLLIATGCHRETRKEELLEKFGEEIVQNEKIVIHDCDDAANMADIAVLPSGGRLVLNKLAVEADLLVAEGFIEPHFFAGYSGGRKSVLPGVASRKTVVYNHNATFIDHPKARTGIVDGNPIHEDMVFAARKANLAFICNVIIDSEKEVVHAVAGDCNAAHEKGVEFLKRLCGVKAVPSDIVITTNGGYPLDQNIYQAVKGMTAAEATVKAGGVTIMLAKSNEGHGGQVFYETFRNQKDLKKMMEGFLATSPEETIIDQWQSQIFARVLMHSHVIYVSDAADELVDALHMIPAHSVEEAVVIADRILEEQGIQNGKILAIPDGVSVIVNR